MFDHWQIFIGFIIILISSSILKWISKRNVKKSTVDLNEAPVKYRRFDAHESKQPFSGWLTAARGILKITPRGIYCEQYVIPVKDIKSVISYKPKQKIARESTLILRIITDSIIYDFSISPFAIKKMNLPFEMITKETTILTKGLKLLFIAVILFAVIMGIIN